MRLIDASRLCVKIILLSECCFAYHMTPEERHLTQLAIEMEAVKRKLRELEHQIDLLLSVI